MTRYFTIEISFEGKKKFNLCTRTMTSQWLHVSGGSLVREVNVLFEKLSSLDTIKPQIVIAKSHLLRYGLFTRYLMRRIIGSTYFFFFLHNLLIQ